MKNMKRILLLLVCSTFFFTFSCSQEVSKAKSLLESQLESKEVADLITQHSTLFPNNTQLSIALIDGEETTYIGIIRDEDVIKITNNEDAVFEIGSISKVFTSILLSKYVRDKKLTLDDKMLALLPVSNEKASEDFKAITLQMLANHTSGLPRISQNMIPVMMANQQNPYKGYTAQLLEDFYSGEIILDNSPNTTYSYSNLAAGTLGYILTKKSNLSYENLLQQDILIPLNMTSSSSILSQIDASKLISGLNADGTEAANWDFTDATVGAGGIKSSVVDMEKFIRKNFEDDEIYNLPQQSTFTVNDNLHVGLGWHISIKEHKNLLWHNGGTGGYRSCMVLSKEGKKAVLVLSNVSAFGSESEKIDNLCFDLMQKL